MEQKSTQKGARLKMKKVLLELPEEEHYALKVRAAEERTTIRGFVAALIKDALKKGGKKA